MRRVLLYIGLAVLIGAVSSAAHAVEAPAPGAALVVLVGR